MTALSTTGNVETLPKNMYLVSNIDAAVTSCKISYVPKAMTQGVLLFDEGTTNEERVGFNGVADNGDGTATLSNLTRGMSYYLNGFAGDPTLARPHTGNACTVRLVWPHEFANLIAYKDQSNTFTNHQLLSGNFEIRFGSSSRAIWVDSGGNLSLKDSNNATKTLSQLAANAGTDEKAKVTAADTTSDYLFNKLLAAAPITVTKGNPGANETLTFALTTPLSVANGGSGASSLTAFAPLFGGTTSTNPVQSGTVGSAGQVLTSNGAGALPTFQAAVLKIPATSLGVEGTYVGASSTAELDLNPSYTIPGNDAVQGNLYKVEAYGLYDYNNSNLTVRFYLGSTAITVGSPNSNGVTRTNKHFYCSVTIVVRTGGASGKANVYALFTHDADAGTTPVHTIIPSGGDSIAVDWTATQLLKFTNQYSASNGSDQCKLLSFTVTKIS